MEIDIKNARLSYNEDGDVELTVITPWRFKESVQRFLGEFKANPSKWILTTSKRRKKRSNNANAYMWQLLEQLSDVLNIGRVDLYKDAIRQAGVMQLVLVTDAGVDRFIEEYESRAAAQGKLGSFAEVAYKSTKNAGNTAVAVYYGSSLYNSKEMSRLINFIVQEAQQQGIETMTPHELAQLGL